MMIPPPTPPVNPLSRREHLAAQLDRNRAYHAALLLAPCPPSVTAADLAAEIANVAEVIRLIEADLGLLAVAGAVADSEGGR